MGQQLLWRPTTFSRPRRFTQSIALGNSVEISVNKMSLYCKEHFLGGGNTRQEDVEKSPTQSRISPGIQRIPRISTTSIKNPICQAHWVALNKVWLCRIKTGLAIKHIWGPTVLGIGAVAGRNNVSFVPRNSLSRETLRLEFSLMTWRGPGAVDSDFLI